MSLKMKTSTRTTKANIGAGSIIDGKRTIASFSREFGSDYEVTLADGTALGSFNARGAACKAARKAANGDAPNSVSLEEAAAQLCPNAQNQVAALRKRISRGAVETVQVDGETRVILPVAA